MATVFHHLTKVRFLVLLIFLLLTSCGYEEVFSPTYHDNVCVPAASALSFLEEPNIQESVDSNYATSDTCCEGSWLVSCCFGGNFICADGSTGVGCGCPLN